MIYYEGQFIERDIEKSIHYFTLASNQNNSGAQYFFFGLFIQLNILSNKI